MVASGNFSVSVENGTGAGSFACTASKTITITPRTWNPETFPEITDGGNGPLPPNPDAARELGETVPNEDHDVTPGAVTSGPNTGYFYLESGYVDYPWVAYVNADIANSSSLFYKAQLTPSSTYLTPAQTLENVRLHEGTIKEAGIHSHWSLGKIVFDSGRAAFATAFEAQLGFGYANTTAFVNGQVLPMMTTRYNAIKAAAATGACGGGAHPCNKYTGSVDLDYPFVCLGTGSDDYTASSDRHIAFTGDYGVSYLGGTTPYPPVRCTRTWTGSSSNPSLVSCVTGPNALQGHVVSGGFYLRATITVTCSQGDNHSFTARATGYNE